jgi:hypothetical protein
MPPADAKVDPKDADSDASDGGQGAQVLVRAISEPHMSGEL